MVVQTTISISDMAIPLSLMDGIFCTSETGWFASSLEELIFEPKAPDIVTPVLYDSFGRQTREYMPYAASTQNGAIHLNPLAETAAFYNIPQYQNTTNPYSEKILENFPLNRVLKQGAPGAPWMDDPLSDNDHTIKVSVRLRTCFEMRFVGLPLG